jgi:hypothetical protein
MFKDVTCRGKNEAAMQTTTDKENLFSDGYTIPGSHITEIFITHTLFSLTQNNLRDFLFLRLTVISVTNI